MEIFWRRERACERKIHSAINYDDGENKPESYRSRNRSTVFVGRWSCPSQCTRSVSIIYMLMAMGSIETVWSSGLCPTWKVRGSIPLFNVVCHLWWQEITQSKLKTLTN